LNISFEATSQLQMGNEWIEFSARFSGKSHKIEVQVANVLAIYARENGQGMAFPVDPAALAAAPDVSGAEGPRSSELVPGEAEHEQVEHRDAMASAQDDNNSPSPDDDGSKSPGRGHLKVVK
jgi:stringent starvation protein B